MRVRVRVRVGAGVGVHELAIAQPRGEVEHGPFTRRCGWLGEADVIGAHHHPPGAVAGLHLDDLIVLGAVALVQQLGRR